MLKTLHPIAGGIGFLTILLLWTSTVVAELFGSVDAIALVKQSIPWGLLILIPALATAGASGARMAGASPEPRLRLKKRRMLVIAGNGILVLVPAALVLASLAARRQFDGLFYGVQAIELIAGATNLTLMALNIRDGFRLTGRWQVAQ